MSGGSLKCEVELVPLLTRWCFFWQRCYEHKQYRNGLKFCKQILSNPKFAEHGGKHSSGKHFCPLVLSSWCICGSFQRPWQWRAWPWTVWGRRRRPTTWWGEACVTTSGATSVSLFIPYDCSRHKYRVAVCHQSEICAHHNINVIFD